jgi:N-acetyl-D-muramate 6-phosphate phosphatase
MMTLNQIIDAVFFDLDGTLLDTAPDLAAACNKVLREYQRPEIPFAQFREWVHGGANMMVCQSFGINTTHPDYTDIKTAFLNHYRQQIAMHTQLFAGMNEVLNYLDQEKIPWGVVTNKPQWLTQPLMAHFGLDARSRCIISGDTLSTAKPHPAPLLHACELTQAQPARSVYVGDTLCDIQAAQAAGMRSIGVCYGYNPPHCNVNEWAADILASTPQHLLTILSDPDMWRKL